MRLGQCGIVCPKLSIKLQKEMAALVKMRQNAALRVHF